MYFCSVFVKIWFCKILRQFIRTLYIKATEGHFRGQLDDSAGRLSLTAYCCLPTQPCEPAQSASVNDVAIDKECRGGANSSRGV